MLCASIEGPSPEEALRQIAEAEPMADLLEFRLDHFFSRSLEDLGRLLNKTKRPCIFTLRPTYAGGLYSGTENQRLSELNDLAALKPALVDFEKQIPLDYFKNFKAHHPHIKLIASYHNFSETPQNLEAILKELDAYPADYFKIAVMATSSADAFKLLSFLKGRERAIIGVSMGEFGQLSRVIAETAWTYACLDERRSVSPGQIPLKTLSLYYRQPEITAKTVLYGLIGNPVKSSLSHLTHNAALKELNIDARYLKMPVLGSELAGFFSFASPINWQGFSVTMPHKEAILAHLHQVDAKAKKIGAVNTLRMENGHWVGYNTDGDGALAALERHVALAGKKAIILGAGGAAKAIAYALLEAGCNVLILSRRKEMARHAARRFGCEGGDLKYLGQETYDVIINCTPVSMPLNAETLQSGCTVMDINTRPLMSDLLLAAKEKNCQLIFGYEMFIEQALLQFKLWFGEFFEVEKAREILKIEALKALKC